MNEDRNIVIFILDWTYVLCQNVVVVVKLNVGVFWVKGMVIFKIGILEDILGDVTCKLCMLVMEVILEIRPRKFCNN